MRTPRTLGKQKNTQHEAYNKGNTKTEEGTKIHVKLWARKGKRALGRDGGVAFVGTLALVEVLVVEVEHDLGAALHDEHLGQHLGRGRG